MRESDLVRACVEILKTNHIFAWRNNSGATKVGKRFIRYGCPGSPDIIGVLPDGKFLGIECKVGKNKPTEKQAAFIDMINSNKGVAIVVRTPQDLQDFIGKDVYGER